ncbi:hypothetical protein HJC23_006955 [Cyclotella cryptica]|uniref:Uncharacterized protein n=1 Tax=Cyclotella cryptica TaxID=29204 RepID=A0ABD3QTN1_9STRA|eukprot:CCRYP_004260-RA/>CCRYP_004260-RA protein AED:0.31 eAED:0.31 QI:1191/1/1/1/0/0/2/196/386
MNDIHSHSTFPLHSNDMELLARRCDELEKRNKELQEKSNELQHQLTCERRCFAGFAGSLKNEMDVLKKTTLELEDQVASLLQSRGDKGDRSINSSAKFDPYYASDLTCMSDDDALQYQSEIDLFRVLCDIWKNKYRELEGQLHHGENDLQEKTTQSTQQRMQQQSKPSSLVSCPIKKLVGRVSSLKNRVRQKSLQIGCVENHDHIFSLPGGSTSSRDGTHTTETTAEASCSSSLSLSSPPLSTPSNNRCLVSSMPWTRSDFHSSGFYSGQIDVTSKLPDGFGVFRCSCTNDHCYLKGDWILGELKQRLDSDPRFDSIFDEDEDGFNQTVPCCHSCTFSTQDVPGNCDAAVRFIDGDAEIQNARNRFSSVHAIHEFRHSDSVSVTEL